VDNTSPKISYGEESMAYTIDKGDYFLKTRLYPQRGSSLPSPSDCAVFPAEAAIVPLSTLVNNPLVNKVLHLAATTTTTGFLHIFDRGN